VTNSVTVDETTLVKMLELLELPIGLKLLTPEQVPYSL